MTQESHIYDLAKKFLAGKMADNEQSEFHAVLQDREKQDDLLAALNDLTDEVRPGLAYDPSLLVLAERAMSVDKGRKPAINIAADNRKTHTITWSWVAYAAVFLITAAAGIFWIFNTRYEKPTIAIAPPQQRAADIPPAANKAMLTLADGRRILLDTAAKAALENNGQISILKLDSGVLALQNKPNSQAGAVEYNTLSTPPGGKYQLLLPDGTRVWLNAASSITFPVAFTGSTRHVTVTGEAYFEVTGNSRQPFEVQHNDMKVAVLGTSFNINAYTNEHAVTTTLLDGSVRIDAHDQARTLMPGQQASVDSNRFAVINGANLEKVMAWKNDLFYFEGVRTRELMRQVARWYDVEVVYEPGVRDVEFVGKMTRNISLSGMLSSLEKLGVNSKLEGRRLIIQP